MALDIFSSFDDHQKVMYDMYLLMWTVIIIMVVAPLSKMWAQYSSKFSSLTVSKETAKDLVKRTNMKKMVGSMALTSAMLTLVTFLNLYGLSPYTFSLSSHLSINLCLSLTMWFSLVLMGLTFNLTSVIAHMQPIGSPWYINPFLCIIELISMLVRPLTLAVRLTANLSTGHILMALLGMGVTESTPWMASVMTILGMFYFLFEIAVCIIQAYIFTLLPTLYADEHPDKSI